MLVVYTSSSCPYCKKVMDYLRLNEHEFIEIDISKDRVGAQHLMKLGINAVPVTEGDDWRVIGYDINGLYEKLNKDLSLVEKAEVQAKLRKKGFM